MRRVLSLILLAVFSNFASAQRGGMPNADESFNRLLSGYGGTGDVVDFSRVSAESRERFNRFAQFSGSPPMPTSGTITRAEYAEQFNKRMESMRGGMMNRGGDRGGPPNAAAPTAQPSVTVTMGAVPPPQAPPERIASDDDVVKNMRRYDKNDDGKISLEEAQSSDRLKPIFAHYDANKDGMIDMAEMKVYVTDRMNNREAGRDQNPGGPPQMPPQDMRGYDMGRDDRRDGRDRSATPEEPLPTVYRFGKLPMKELPSWFESLDTDKDGQIGLYEWREGKKATAEFVSMDLNADGLLTADEYLRWKKAPTPVATNSAMTALTTSKDSKETKKDERKDDKRGNAFRR